jgi:hypothetical protein
LQVRIERVEIRPVERAQAQIRDVAIEDLAIKWRRRFGRFGGGIGKKNHSPSQPRQDSFESRAAQLRFVERFGFDVVIFQELDRFFQICGIH